MMTAIFGNRMFATTFRGQFCGPLTDNGKWQSLSLSLFLSLLPSLSAALWLSFFPMSVTIRFWCQCSKQQLKKWITKKKKRKGLQVVPHHIQLIVKGITIFLNLHFSLVDGEPMTYFSTYHFSFKKIAALFFTA